MCSGLGDNGVASKVSKLMIDQNPLIRLTSRPLSKHKMSRSPIKFLFPRSKYSKLICYNPLLRRTGNLKRLHIQYHQLSFSQLIGKLPKLPQSARYFFKLRFLTLISQDSITENRFLSALLPPYFQRERDFLVKRATRKNRARQTLCFNSDVNNVKRVTPQTMTRKNTSQKHA